MIKTDWTDATNFFQFVQDYKEQGTMNSLIQTTNFLVKLPRSPRYLPRGYFPRLCRGDVQAWLWLWQGAAGGEDGGGGDDDDDDDDDGDDDQGSR